ncbi:hypothetical protein D3C78_589570 [compost metagenome]
MAEGHQHALAGQLAEVGGEQELHRLHEVPGGGGVADHHQQQDEQPRHHEAQRALQPVAHAESDDAQGHQQHQTAVGGQLPRIGEQGVEQRAAALAIQAGEAAAQRRGGVGQRPAGDHRIEAEDQEAGEHRHAAEAPPVPAGAGLAGHRGDGALGVGAAAPADHELGHQQRDADGQDAGQVDQHEGAAAVLPGDVGKLPDVAQTDRRTGGGEEEYPARRPQAATGRAAGGAGDGAGGDALLTHGACPHCCCSRSAGGGGRAPPVDQRPACRRSRARRSAMLVVVAPSASARAKISARVAPMPSRCALSWAGVASPRCRATSMMPPALIA